MMEGSTHLGISTPLDEPEEFLSDTAPEHALRRQQRQLAVPQVEPQARRGEQGDSSSPSTVRPGLARRDNAGNQVEVLVLLWLSAMCPWRNVQLPEGRGRAGSESGVQASRGKGQKGRQEGERGRQEGGGRTVVRVRARDSHRGCFEFKRDRTDAERKVCKVSQPPDCCGGAGRPDFGRLERVSHVTRNVDISRQSNSEFRRQVHELPYGLECH